MKKNIILFIFLTLGVVAFSQSSKIYLVQTYKIYAVDGDDFVYLGKLASPYDAESIFNSYCQYGNEYNFKSIWNEYGKYGNEFNSQSPWNEFSSTPPILVNNNNEIVGYFTSNELKCVRELIPMMRYIKKHYAKCATKPEEVYKLFFY